jgi:hypothetical protein
MFVKRSSDKCNIDPTGTSQEKQNVNVFKKTHRQNASTDADPAQSYHKLTSVFCEKMQFLQKYCAIFGINGRCGP